MQKETRTRKMPHTLKWAAKESLDQSAFRTGEAFILLTEL